VLRHSRRRAPSAATEPTNERVSKEQRKEDSLVRRSAVEQVPPRLHVPQPPATRMAPSTSTLLLRIKPWLSVLTVAATLGGAVAVRCVCSSPSECENLTDADCPTGSALVWDPCGCCRVCSRLEFEPCGGPDGFHGTCAAGLECVADHADLLGTCRREYIIF
jgi:hypothetical protein